MVDPQKNYMRNCYISGVEKMDRTKIINDIEKILIHVGRNTNDKEMVGILMTRFRTSSLQKKPAPPHLFDETHSRMAEDLQ